MDINNIRNSRQDSKADGAALGITYGYIRVSTALQHDDRQRIAMEEFGITADYIFTDRQSGKDFDRPAYMDMMAALKPGDTVVVNIKTPHLIQSQTMVQTSKVLATRASEVFYCPNAAPFCQQARVAQNPICWCVDANRCIFKNVIVGKVCTRYCGLIRQARIVAAGLDGCSGGLCVQSYQVKKKIPS